MRANREPHRGPYHRSAKKSRPRGFAAWMDAQRIRAGLTFDELASLSGVSRRALFAIAKSAQPPAPELRDKVKAAFGAVFSGKKP